MNDHALKQRFIEIAAQSLPLPGAGNTAERHRRLAETAREDISLAKLAEAHWDAVAILTEAGRTPAPGALYAVWASEAPGKAIDLVKDGDGYTISGSKPFCSGIGLVDRALVTVGPSPTRLVELDLHRNRPHIETDLAAWKVDAFRNTHTGALQFRRAEISADALVGGPGWYIERPGFWHGACGPAACWAGGAAGLVDFALTSRRRDPHTLAHLGAMHAEVWALLALLTQAGHEIDAAPNDGRSARIRALQLRHMVETMGTDILRRFARAYGPQPLSMNEEVARRYAEADLFLRQSHGERDLESLAHLVLERSSERPKERLNEHSKERLTA